MTTAAQATSQTIELNGLRFHYLDWDNEGATPLVLLHGLSSASGTWRRVAEHFAPTYRVVALDQRGHGETEHAPAGDYATDDFVRDIEAFADALGLDRFILCGQSMGGHNTIAFTARHPERVICALANDMPPRRRDNVPAPPDAPPVFESIEANMAQRMENSPLTPEWAARLSAEASLKQVDGGWTPRVDPNVLRRWDAADLWDEARTITRPIFFIRGGQSQVLDAQTLQDMDMAIPASRSITLEQAGHNTYHDMEPEWLAGAGEFFAAHSR
jgi:pimeloyl-ACP methyl ester carboxylesterase